MYKQFVEAQAWSHAELKLGCESKCMAVRQIEEM